ncbi:hypothetical protein ACIQXF_03265 [Lysinibacillus sp. NPDC097231]
MKVKLTDGQIGLVQ